MFLKQHTRAEIILSMRLPILLAIFSKEKVKSGLLIFSTSTMIWVEFASLCLAILKLEKEQVLSWLYSDIMIPISHSLLQNNTSYITYFTSRR